MALLLGVLVWGVGASSPARAQAPAVINWSGIQWNVKSGAGLGPGVNTWIPSNVSVDANGDLHLSITNVDGTWTCAEIGSTVNFGFGAFQWQVATAIDKLDPNVVLGLFLYGPTALGPDGTHEIDVEYARFGSATADNGRWTIFPNVIAPLALGRSSYQLVLGGDPTTTSRFAWGSTSVAFTTLGGFQSAGSNANLIRSWNYLPADPTTTISQSPMPVHMNLWLDRGNPPTDGQGVEIVIHSFSFTPAAATTAIPAQPAGGAFVLAACLVGVALFSLGSTWRRPRRRPRPSTRRLRRDARLTPET